MLVLKRKDGQWTEIKGRNGDVLRVRVTNVNYGPSGRYVDLVFDDPDRNFDIQRPERVDRNAAAVVEPAQAQ